MLLKMTVSCAIVPGSKHGLGEWEVMGQNDFVCCRYAVLLRGGRASWWELCKTVFQVPWVTVVLSCLGYIIEEEENNKYKVLPFWQLFLFGKMRSYRLLGIALPIPNNLFPHHYKEDGFWLLLKHAVCRLFILKLVRWASNTYCWPAAWSKQAKLLSLTPGRQWQMTMKSISLTQAKSSM